MQYDLALYDQALMLLKALIRTPSFSKEEAGSAAIIADAVRTSGLQVQQHLNNVWVMHPAFDRTKPTLLLNSHHDTVRANAHWQHDPFTPIVEGGKLYGLGSNDAGASLVALWAAFLHFAQYESLAYNLVWAATAEEEISGEHGIASIRPMLPQLDCAIVGEPTGMQLAVAEKGLLVLDCTAYGTAGHAARDEGVNAIYAALPDIAWFQSYQFPKVSDWLGPVRMNVTQIEAGKQHNVVPDECRFVVDIRLNDLYDHATALSSIREHVKCTVQPRSDRLKPSHIPLSHPLVQAGLALGLQPYGSPTLSDVALLPCPALKMGPGDSARSHTADEYIQLDELRAGIGTYIALLSRILIP